MKGKKENTVETEKVYTNYDDFGIHFNNYSVIYNSNLDTSSMENVVALNTVEYFTMPLDYTYKRHKKEYKDIFRDKWGYLFDNGSIYFKFWKLSDLSFSKDYVQIFQSANRFEKCHHYCLKFSEKFNPCHVVTGYVDSNSGKILHSWIEKQMGEDILVFDFTKNLIINRQDYYSLLDVLVLESITSSKVNEDTCYFSIPCMNDLFYCVFGNALICNLEKNKSLIKKR